MKKGTRIAIIVIVVLVVFLGGGIFAYTRVAGPEGGPGRTGFSGFGPGAGRGGAAEGGEPEQFSVPVAVTAVQRNSARQTLTLYGSVYAEREVSILPTVSGKITEIKVEEGDFVRTDQVLAVIDRDQAGLKFAPAAVESTISGIVKSVMTQEGAAVNPGAPLFQIVDMDVVEVFVDVPEKRIAQVEVGKPVEISVVSYPDRVFFGTIDSLSPVLDPASRSLKTRIRVLNPGYELKPGMFAEAQIILQEREQALTVPLAAVVDKQGQQVVFVVEGDAVREVEPEIAFLYNGWAVVDAGFEQGDMVVVIGQQSLSGGDAVTVAEVKE